MTVWSVLGAFLLASAYPHPCNHSGCPALTRTRYCPAHTKQHDATKNARRGNGWAWTAVRAQVLREEPRCRQCGAVATTVDHITAIADGGNGHRVNLQALCARCHTLKSTHENASRMAARR